MTAADTGRTDGLAEQTGFVPGRFCWPHLDRERAAVLWAELVDWTTWLRETYELHQKVLPCWFAHPEVREELTALMAAHKAAYADHEDATYWTDMAYWHVQFLRPFIGRLPGMFDSSECRSGQCGFTPPVADTLESIHDYIGTDIETRPEPAAPPEAGPGALVEVMDPRAVRAAIDAGEADFVDPGNPFSDVDMNGRRWRFDTDRNAYTPHTRTDPPE